MKTLRNRKRVDNYGSLLISIALAIAAGYHLLQEKWYVAIIFIVSGILHCRVFRQPNIESITEVSLSDEKLVFKHEAGELHEISCDSVENWRSKLRGLTICYRHNEELLYFDLGKSKFDSTTWEEITNFVKAKFMQEV